MTKNATIFLLFVCLCFLSANGNNVTTAAPAAPLRTVSIDGVDIPLTVAKSGPDSTGERQLNTEISVTIKGLDKLSVQVRKSRVETELVQQAQALFSDRDKKLVPRAAVILEPIRSEAAPLFSGRRLAANDTVSFNALVVAPSTEDKLDREELECGITINEDAFEAGLRDRLKNVFISAANDIQVPDVELVSPLKACKKCRACEAGVFNGLVAQHFVGLFLMLLFLPIGLDSIFRLKFAEYYQPGTPWFFLRLTILEGLDLLCVALVYNFDKQVQTGVLVLPTMCNTVAMFISFRFFKKGRKHARRRQDLIKELENTVQGASGEQHVSDKLLADIEEYNKKETKHYEQMKSIFMVLFGMEIGDVEFVAAQYYTFCSRTACSYFGQLATVMSASLLLNSILDFRELKVALKSGKTKPPLLIDIDHATKSINPPAQDKTTSAKSLTRSGSSRHNMSKQKLASATSETHQHYQYVRSLLDDMLKDSDAALYMYANPGIGTAPMSLEIHEMNMSPTEDPRADAVVWATVVTRACWRTVVIDKASISMTVLLLLKQLVENVREQLDGFSNRTKLEMDVDLMQRTVSRGLPEAVIEDIRAEAERWQRMQTHESLSAYCVKLVTGIDNQWSGEFCPAIELCDGAVEYRRERSKKQSDLALYRDQIDHNWKICEVDDKDSRQPPSFWNTAPTSDVPPQHGWASERGELQSLKIEQQPLDTFAIRCATSSFLNAGKSDVQNQLHSYSRMQFPITIYDDAVLQWAYMKATYAEVCLVQTRAGPVAKKMVKSLKNLKPGDATPKWVLALHEELKGEDDNDKLGEVIARMELNESLQVPNAGISKADSVRQVLLCSSSMLMSSDRDEVVLENILRATLDQSVPKEQIGTDSRWPLQCTLSNSRFEKNAKPSLSTQVSERFKTTWRGSKLSRTRISSRNKAGIFFGRTMTIRGRVIKIPEWFWLKEQVQHKGLYVVVLSVYAACFLNAARFINGTNEELDSITLFGLPPQYDLTDPVQAKLVPLLYANMHCNLFTFALLPLPMCRCVIKNLSSSPTLSKILHLDHAQFWHRILGYMLILGVLAGGVIWWFAMGHSCVENDVQKSCDVFHTPPNEELGMGVFESYFNIYENLAAVLFLRELVITSFIAIFSTALLVYPLDAAAKALPVGWIQRHAWELFYYTHLAFFTTLVTLAMSSRFDVFRWTAPAWGLYYLDVLWMRLMHTSCTSARAVYSGDPTNFVHLKVNKTGRFFARCWESKFHFSAGQTAFINIPAISKLEWHPFSIASAPSDKEVEFLIDAGKYGKDSWTGRLWNMLAERQLGSDFHVNMMGPCGSAFQAASSYYGLVLVGGGSGLTSSLSVLRDTIAHHRKNATANPRKVWMIWVTRHVDSMIWCWDALKHALEGTDITIEQKRENVAELSEWLDVSIHVTGCARSEEERVALDRLIKSEEKGTAASPGLAGEWLVQQDRIKRSRVKSWRDKFVAVHATLPRDSKVKVCFCGPTAMASAIGEATRSIDGFDAQFSSENFNEGKRPTPKFDDHVQHQGSSSGLIATDGVDPYKAYGADVGGHSRSNRTGSGRAKKQNFMKKRTSSIGGEAPSASLTAESSSSSSPVAQAWSADMTSSNLGTQQRTNSNDWEAAV